MPAIMPRPLAYVFKKELLREPFFGWSKASLEALADCIAPATGAPAPQAVP